MLDAADALSLVDDKRDLLLSSLNEKHGATNRLLRALRRADLLRALSPREVGGLASTTAAEFELIRALTVMEPALGWTFLILAGTTARIAAVAPVAERERLFTGPAFPAIAMHDDPRGCTVDHTGSGFRFQGSWRFATGVADADWVVLYGLATDRLRQQSAAARWAHATHPSQIEIDVHANDLMGLRETRTFAYSADLCVPAGQAFHYQHNSPNVDGAGFLVRRSPVKHLAFAVGIAEYCVSATRSAATRASESCVRRSFVEWEIRAASLACYARALLQSVDELLPQDVNSAGKLMDRVQGVARFATVDCQRIAHEALMTMGVTTAETPLRQRFLAATTALGHVAVRPPAYDLCFP